MSAWETGWAQRSQPSLRVRRRVRHLRPPMDGPAASVWASLGGHAQEQLRWEAGADREATEPGRAVVLAALQRQLEARRDRWAGLQLAGVLALFVVIVLVTPGGHRAVFAGLVGGGVGHLQEVRTTRARRANERRASEGGYPVDAAVRGRWWGMERPVTGDPLFAVAILAVAALWLLPLPDVHPVARVLALPVAVLCVAWVLGTVRGIVRALRARSEA